MDKNFLRSEMRKIRLSIGNKEIKSHEIFLKLISDPKVQNAKSILCYINTTFEVDTREFIEWCWRNDKNVYIPFLKIQEVAKIENWNELAKVGKYYESKKGINNHVIANEVKQSVHIKDYFVAKASMPTGRQARNDITVAIVPGLAFDANGNRLGQGSGWYDKYLSSDIYKIGICFKEQLIDEIPMDLHDVKMNLIVTD